MFSFLNFKSKTKELDFKDIGIEMHSHLIPGIDDGVKTTEESISIIRRLKKAGYHKVITTPHIMSDYYRNTPEIINKGLEKVKAALQKENIDIELEAAAEYFVDDYFEKLIKNDEPLLTFSDNRILIEQSAMRPSPNLGRVIFLLNTKGYKPILAHPERYTYYLKDFEKLKKIKSYNCEFQLNMLSLTKHYGPHAYKLAIKLLEEGMIDYIGSDIHHGKHLSIIEKQFVENSKIRKWMDKYQFKNNQL